MISDFDFQGVPDSVFEMWEPGWTGYELPKKNVLCTRCDGEGKHGPGWVVTQSDREEMGDEFYEYMENMQEGRYDVRCEDCGGRGVRKVPDVERMDPDLLADLEEWVQEFFNYRAEVEAERRAGC